MADGQKDLQRAKTAITSPWVFADVQAIANEFSTSELIVKERRGTKLEDVENHELEKIWESPNEHMGRSS
jgi:phage portal protein BeeE